MRPGFLLLLLLVLSLALRGFANDLHLPAKASAPVAHTESCHETQAPQAAKHDRACQINCDLTAAAALPAATMARASALPDQLTPTRPILGMGDPLPPDHPPPIA